MKTHIDLFSGIGGFALAAGWAGFETVVFCEKDEYCQKVLKKHWPDVPIIAEIRDFKWPLESTSCLRRRGGNHGNEARNERTLQAERSCSSDKRGTITLLTGGFPCQPFSVAGKRRGKEDDRFLWPEMFRVISEVRPTWVLAENVTGIINMELDKCLSDLEGEGYETETFIIPACGVDAPHRRSRVWIVAYDEGRESRESETRNRGEGSGGGSEKKPTTWPVEPDVGRVAHGIPFRVDRLKALGNAIVPQVAYEIMRAIFLY